MEIKAELLKSPLDTLGGSCWCVRTGAEMRVTYEYSDEDSREHELEHVFGYGDSFWKAHDDIMRYERCFKTAEVAMCYLRVALRSFDMWRARADATETAREILHIEEEYPDWIEYQQALNEQFIREDLQATGRRKLRDAELRKCEVMEKSAK